jgi:hypothetical protein
VSTTIILGAFTTGIIITPTAVAGCGGVLTTSIPFPSQTLAGSAALELFILPRL